MNLIINILEVFVLATVICGLIVYLEVRRK